MAFTKITAAGIGSTETVTIDGLSVINDGSFGGNVSVAEFNVVMVVTPANLMPVLMPIDPILVSAIYFFLVIYLIS